jgi:hypothetical protein
VDSTSVTDMLLRHRQLRPLAANPQILNLICLIATHGLGDLETRSQIYDLALYELCQRSNRPLPEYPTGWEVSPAIKRRILEQVALILMGRNASTRAFSHHELRQTIQNALDDTRLSAAPAGFAELLRREWVAQGILRDSGDSCFFLHNTVGEFLAGSALARIVNEDKDLLWLQRRRNTALWHEELRVVETPCSIEKLVSRKAWDPAWHETLCFLAGMAELPMPLFNVLVDERRKWWSKEDDLLRHRLALAAWCLAEIPSHRRAQTVGVADQITTAAVLTWWRLVVQSLNRGATALLRAFAPLALVNANVSWKGRDIPAARSRGRIQMSGFLESMVHRTYSQQLSKEEAALRRRVPWRTHETPFVGIIERLLIDPCSFYMQNTLPICAEVFPVVMSPGMIDAMVERLDASLGNPSEERQVLHLLLYVPIECLSAEMSKRVMKRFKEDHDYYYGYGYDDDDFHEIGIPMLQAAVRFRLRLSDGYDDLSKNKYLFWRLLDGDGKLARLTATLVARLPIEPKSDPPDHQGPRTWSAIVAKAMDHLEALHNSSENEDDRYARYYVEPTDVNLKKLAEKMLGRRGRHYHDPVYSIIAIGQASSSMPIWRGLATILPIAAEEIWEEFLMAVRTLRPKGIPAFYQSALLKMVRASDTDHKRREWALRMIGALGASGITDELLSELLVSRQPDGLFATNWLQSGEGLAELTSDGVRVFYGRFSSGDVLAPPTTSTKGMMCGGLNG